MASVKAPKLRIESVPLDSLHPNPWNPNRMDERTYEAERESIREYGFIDPITVRPHLEHDGEWEILDGEHRKKAARDEGYDYVPIVSVGAITDAAARKLTIILNETRGEADVALLGRLLAELSRDIEREELSVGLPFSTHELDHLIQIGMVDWDDWQKQQGISPSPDDDGGEVPGEREVALSYAEEDWEKFNLYVDMIGRERGIVGPPAIVLHALREIAESL